MLHVCCIHINKTNNYTSYVMSFSRENNKIMHFVLVFPALQTSYSTFKKNKVFKSKYWAALEEVCAVRGLLVLYPFS